jgi:hypothetical protein
MNETVAVLDLLKAADASLFPAADSGELVSLLQRVRTDLRLEPPPEYMAFLRQTDGAVADGLMLYGAKARLIDDAEMPALVEINLRRRAYREDLADLLQLGEIDDDIVGFHPSDRQYWRIDRTSGECQEKSGSLRDMVARLMTHS